MFEDNPMCSDILSLHCREPVSQTASDLDSDPEHNKCEFTGIDSSMERGESREGERGRVIHFFGNSMFLFIPIKQFKMS